jgi:hypothetical protein
MFFENQPRITNRFVRRLLGRTACLEKLREKRCAFRFFNTPIGVLTLGAVSPDWLISPSGELVCWLRQRFYELPELPTLGLQCTSRGHGVGLVEVDCDAVDHVDYTETPTELSCRASPAVGRA